MFREIIKFFGETIVYGFTGVASVLVSVFLIPIYTRILTPEDYGVIAILVTLFSILGVVANMGISTALFRSYFLTKEKDRKDVVGTAFISLTASPLLLSLLVFLISGFISRILFGEDVNSYFIKLSALALFFNTGISIPLAILRAEGRPVNFISINLTKILSTVFLSLFLVVFLDFGLAGVFWANLGGAILGYLMGLRYVLRKIRLVFSSYWLIDMLKFGAPMVPAGLAMWVLNSSDKYFLNAFAGTSEVGIYNIGYKVGSLVMLVVGALQLAYPRFKWAIYSKKPRPKEYFRKINVYFYLLTFTVALATSIFSKEAVQILTGSAFHSAYAVVPLISFSYVAYGLFQNFATGITVTGKTYLSTFAVLIGGILNLILNYIFISNFGMMGAAVSTLLSFIILAFAELYFSQKVYPINYEFKRLFTVAAVGAVLVYLSSLVNLGLLASFGVKGLIFLTFPVLLYLFGFFEGRELKKLEQIWLFAKKSRFQPKRIIDGIKQEMIA